MGTSSQFKFPLHCYRHHIGFDARTGECLGLIRGIVLCSKKDSDGKNLEFVPEILVILYDDGRERARAFHESEVGYIDLEPSINLSNRELLLMLDTYRRNIEFEQMFWGCCSKEVENAEAQYQRLLTEVKEIMCANRMFSLQEYQFLMATHYLSGIA